MASKHKKRQIISSMVFVQDADSSKSPNELFERKLTEDYVQEWTEMLIKSPNAELLEGMLSVLIFRLSQEWLALPTQCFKEIIHYRPIHSIPHRRGKVLLGIINLNGELQLCVDLKQLLEIGSFTKKTIHSLNQQEKMVAIFQDKDLWIFPVDEIDGIYKWNLADIKNVPINIVKSTANYLKGIMNFNQRKIGLMDEELLFYRLKRNIL